MSKYIVIATALESEGRVLESRQDVRFFYIPTLQGCYLILDTKLVILCEHGQNELTKHISLSRNHHWRLFSTGKVIE
jgi:hypothetical protein